MSARMRWILILILALVLVGLRLWDWWAEDSDPHRGRIELLEEQAEILLQSAQAARQQADTARQALVSAEEQLAAERLLRERERVLLERRARDLESRAAELRRKLDAPPTLAIADLTDLELAGRASIALTLFVPVASPPPRIRPAAEGGFAADRSAVTAALVCAERMSWCREAINTSDDQRAVLESLVELERQDAMSWRTQAETCQDSDRKCREALEAAAQLEANRMQQLEARALQVRALERRVWRQRLEKYGLTAGAAAAGYFVGQHLGGGQ